MELAGMNYIRMQATGRIDRPFLYACVVIPVIVEIPPSPTAVDTGVWDRRAILQV